MTSKGNKETFRVVKIAYGLLWVVFVRMFGWSKLTKLDILKLSILLCESIVCIYCMFMHYKNKYTESDNHEKAKVYEY